MLEIGHGCPDVVFVGAARYDAKQRVVLIVCRRQDEIAAGLLCFVARRKDQVFASLASVRARRPYVFERDLPTVENGTTTELPSSAGGISNTIGPLSFVLIKGMM